MDAVNHVSLAGGARDERGFSLVEVIVATMVLAIGVLPLVGIFAMGVQQMGASTPMMLAREKAREAIESVHAARDTGEASWATIRNAAQGGVFLDAAIAIKNPGPDGLVNTADDLLQADQLPAGLFTREIDILNRQFRWHRHGQSKSARGPRDRALQVEPGLADLHAGHLHLVVLLMRIFSMRPATRHLAATAGFSLVELLVAMGLFTVIMGATMAGLADVMKGNELIMTISAMNGGLRSGTDVMIRDLLQAGSGLPASHTVKIPSGAGSVPVRIPGPPGTAFQTAVGDLVLPAVMPARRRWARRSTASTPMS